MSPDPFRLAGETFTSRLLLGTAGYPTQRILVDAGDTKPSPPGIFVVWDGLGLVVRRVALLPDIDPARVKITSDNPKYDPSERTVDEAHIQGRVIGQWRWL